MLGDVDGGVTTAGMAHENKKEFFVLSPLQLWPHDEGHRPLLVPEDTVIDANASINGELSTLLMLDVR